MLLALNNSFFNRFGLEGSVQKCMEAGFRAIDLSLIRHDENPLFGPESAEHIRAVKAILDAHSAVVHQTHAPFATYIEGNDEYNRVTGEAIHRAIELSAAFGAKQIIIHPTAFPELTAAEQMEKNLALYAPFGERAKKCGVKIAIENMWNVMRDCPDKICKSVCSSAEELCTYMDALGEGYTVCLDVGHAGLACEVADKMIPILGKARLGALHIHDNDFYADDHTAPFLGLMNWDALTCALAAIDYDECFTYEVVGAFSRRMPTPLLPSAGKFLFDIGTYLVSEIERKKKKI